MYEEIDWTDEEIIKVFDDLTYNGFDMMGVRKQFGKSKDGKDIDVDIMVNNIIMCLISLAKAGNNLDRLTNKVKVAETGKKIKVQLKRIGVKTKALMSTDITLPRTGIAFMAAYIHIRRISKLKLQSQVNCGLPVEFMDLSFCGVNEISVKREYQQFYLRFNQLIKKNDEDSDDEEHERNVKRTKRDARPLFNDLPWVKVATTGFENDNDLIKNDVKAAVIKEKSEMNDVKLSIKLVLAVAGVKIDDAMTEG